MSSSRRLPLAAVVLSAAALPSAALAATPYSSPSGRAHSRVVTYERDVTAAPFNGVDRVFFRLLT